MKIGPRYKIARRLGGQVFDKTSGAKFADRLARRKEASGKGRGRGQKSDFGLQMLEKQKARFTYGINERQFAKYVKTVVAMKNVKADEELYAALESRLDNVVYRLGLANSRAFARQLVSHGHILVNGRKASIPSYRVSPGDKISARAGSLKKKPFENVADKIKQTALPTWLTWDIEKVTAEVKDRPRYSPTEVMFDVSAILEFYKR